jgi:hypothetical protein
VDCVAATRFAKWWILCSSCEVLDLQKDGGSDSLSTEFCLDSTIGDEPLKYRLQELHRGAVEHSPNFAVGSLQIGYGALDVLAYVGGNLFNQPFQWSPLEILERRNEKHPAFRVRAV